jgi:hypothetical protein
MHQAAYADQRATSSRNQGDGMGLPDYRAMPSLRDVSQDGSLCTFSKAVDQPQTGLIAVVRQSWRHGPVHHVQNHTPLGHSPPASQAGRRVGPAL